MQASSRESYRAARERLESYAAEAQPDAVSAVADELLAVARTLAREPRLRRALSDPARPGPDRAQLLDDIVAGKVSEDARTILTALASGRWASSADLLDATEQAGVDALLASAERDGKLADVEDQLFRFGQIVSGDPALASTLGDPTSDPERRIGLVRDLLADRAYTVTARLAELAVVGFGGRNFEASLTRLVELAAGRRERHVAYVTVATPLSEDDERRLGAALAEMYGREVSLKVVVDPNVLGGARVQIDNDLYDGTIARRLMQTRNALVGRR